MGLDTESWTRTLVNESTKGQEQNMAIGASTVVIVTRKERDGWFVYTSDDIPGLYVANRDDRVAYNDIPASIRLLVKLNDGIDCQVSHAVSYTEFVRQLRAKDQLDRRTEDLMAEHPDMLRFVLQSLGAHQAT